MSDEPETKVQETFRGYALCACGLLVLLTVAILTPDYLNYRYKRDRLMHPQPAKADSAMVSTPLPSASVGGTPTVNTSTNVGQSALGKDVELLKASDIYETYAKLVTMMLGFVSVVGVLAGYFVRKSVRELTEDVRIEVAREVRIFERQRTDALEKVKDSDDATKKALAEAAKIKGELEDLLKKVSTDLKALNEMAEGGRTQKKSLLGSARETSSQVDEQLGDLS